MKGLIVKAYGYKSDYVGKVVSDPFYASDGAVVIVQIIEGKEDEIGIFFEAAIQDLIEVKKEHVLHADQPFVTMEGGDANFTTSL